MIPAGGVLDLPVTATTPGCFKLRFIPDQMPAPPTPNACSCSSADRVSGPPDSPHSSTPMPRSAPGGAGPLTCSISSREYQRPAAGSEESGCAPTQYAAAPGG